VAQLWTVFTFFAVATVFAALVDPTFDFGWTGATVFVGCAVAIPLTMAAYSYPAEWYQRRASKVTGKFRTITLALLIALVLTVMSRLVHFVPGYVYGLIVGLPQSESCPRPRRQSRCWPASRACSGSASWPGSCGGNTMPWLRALTCRILRRSSAWSWRSWPFWE
jgi:hypothetical protein